MHYGCSKYEERLNGKKSGLIPSKMLLNCALHEKLWVSVDGTWPCGTTEHSTTSGRQQSRQWLWPLLGGQKRAVEASGKKARDVGARQPGARQARLTCGAREVGVHHSLVIGILIQIQLENKVPCRFVILLGACPSKAGWRA